MKKFIRYLVFLSLISFSYVAYSDNHMPRTYAMEGYQCNLADGKGLDDVLRVASKWDKWADSNYSVPYAAWVMTPFYQTKSDFGFDLGWLGFSTNWQTLGQAQDEWMAKGQRLRDEAHRFAINTHRAKRQKGIRKSLLDQINGIGSIRKRALLNHFGSARAVESASFDEIKSVEGVEEKVAKKIYNFFHE